MTRDYFCPLPSTLFNPACWPRRPSHTRIRGVTQALATGQPAPAFALKAVASGRVFRPADYIGRLALLIFVDHNTGRSAEEVVVAIRRQYPQFEQLAIAMVVDARIVPRLMRGIAEGMMAAGYREAAQKIPAGFDAANHLILLPDWSGEVVRAYRVGDVSKEIALVLIGPDGRVAASHHGPNPAQTALELVRPFLAGD